MFNNLPNQKEVAPTWMGVQKEIFENFHRNFSGRMPSNLARRNLN
jgi:hypothetical protein